MCVVSSLGDYWRDRIPTVYPWIDPTGVPYPYQPQPYTSSKTIVVGPGVSQEEFDKLKKEVEELKILLKAAIKFDEATGQPDCELDEKVELIKKVAEMVGVNLDDVFKKT